jgi:tetratricopeptide (TPR) repeat protein
VVFLEGNLSVAVVMTHMLRAHDLLHARASLLLHRWGRSHRSRASSAGTTSMATRLSLYLLICAARAWLALAKPACAENAPQSRATFERVGMVVFRFSKETGGLELRPWRVVAEDLIITELRQVRALQILPNASVERALRQMDATNAEPAAVDLPQKLGKLINAHGLVWGRLDRRGGEWFLDVQVRNLETGGTCKSLSTASTNLCETVDRMVNEMLLEFRVKPTSAEEQRRRQGWTDVPSALEWYGKAKVLAEDGQPTAKLENCYRQAIKEDPKFIVAHGLLAALLASKGEWEDAENVARRAVDLDPASAAGHKILGASLFNRGKIAEAEKELQAAAKLDAYDADTLARLGYLYYGAGRPAEAIGAYRAALKLDPFGPSAAAAHAQLGYVFACQGERETALTELQEAILLVSPIDTWAEQNLANGFQRLARISLAIEHCEKFIQLAAERKEYAEQIKVFEQFLLAWKPRLAPTYYSVAPPREYTEETLKEALNQKLTLQEARLVENPFASTPEMQHWAADLVKGATNDLQRAQLLFEALIQHVDNNAVLSHRQSATARQIFAEWTKPKTSVHCQEASILFVALSRAAGLKAYIVKVQEACDGTRTAHQCAAVYIRDKAILVDATYFWFGAPHKQFMVLDDVQTCGEYLSTSGDLQRAQIAAKLAPDLPQVEYALSLALIRAGRWSQARELLPQVRRLDTNGVLANSLEAYCAVHEGRLASAVNLLQQATKIDPHSFALFYQLGHTCALQGKWNEARAALRNAMLCTHAAEEAEEARKALAQIENK